VSGLGGSVTLVAGCADTALLHDAGPSGAGMQNRRVGDVSATS